MKLKYSGIPIILIMILMLTACKDKKDDLFRQEPGDKTLAQGAEAKEQAPTPAEVVLGEEEAIPTLAEAVKATPAPMPTEAAAVTATPTPAKEADTQDDTDAVVAAIADNQNNNPDINLERNKDRNEANNEDSGEEQQETMEDSFYYQKLNDDIKARINGKSYAKDCKVPYSELRYVKVLHYGFDGEIHEGELIVNKAIAQDIVDIFKELYEVKYPIEKMVLVDEYDADDNASMADNNTSCFNYRVVEGTDRISLHGYGLAIDVNPLYNPYVHTIKGETVITPINGVQYADRSLDNEYYIKKGDAAYDAFVNRGFTWGGAWKNSKDYQHFQKELE